jgi:hypothetical protein
MPVLNVEPCSSDASQQAPVQLHRLTTPAHHLRGKASLDERSPIGDLSRRISIKLAAQQAPRFKQQTT